MPAIVVLVLYVAGSLLLAASAFRMQTQTERGRQFAGLALSALGAVTHGVVLWQAFLAYPALALNVTDTASLIGWLLATIAIGIGVWNPRFIAISSVLLIIAAVVALATNEGDRMFAVAQRSWELTAHILLSTLAYALVTVAAAFAIALSLLHHRLRRRRPLGWLVVLPSVEALESGMFQAIGLGFALLSLALFSGFIFVQNLLAQHLIHKTVLSLLTWVILAVLLIGHWRFGWRGRLAINWTIGGFMLLGIAYFGSKWVLETLLGRHWG